MNQPKENPATKGENQLRPPVGGCYAKYVLFVLVIIYIFNFIDRQILSILAEEIKADIGVSDAEMGFLYGTAFAVFYAVFGIPMGRLADTWARKSLISIGLLFWSLMTALSGTARSFAVLASYRIGVGIGEASASPASYSMISDYFSPKFRTTALSVYASGVYIGMGIGMFLGGLIVDQWAMLYPTTEVAPLNLKGWHVAFFAVGLPGVVMAIWAWTLKEPLRGQSEGLETQPHKHPFRETWLELLAIIPPFHLFRLMSLGAGIKGITINICAAIAVILVTSLMIQLTGSLVQWLTLGIGVFSGFCWAQSLAIRDKASFAMIFKCKTVMYVMIGFPFISFVAYGLNFWIPPFFQRIHGVSAADAGMILGLSIAIGGWTGVILGGVIADKLRIKYIGGKLYVSIASAIISTPFAIGVLMLEDITAAYLCNFLFAMTSAMWIGPAAATVNDLVMPRMRAIASAFYLMMTTFIGLSLGPYTMGRVSDFFISQGKTSAEGLTYGMLFGISAYIVAIILLGLASRTIRQDEGSRLERAKAMGESFVEQPPKALEAHLVGKAVTDH